MSESSVAQGEYTFYDFKPDDKDMAEEVLEGLSRVPKIISPKYFYDERGSKLFEQITELDEYYLTRTEMALFDAYLPDIARLLGENLCLIEYGSGSSLKIRKLLEAITPSAYVPVDISHQHLQENARRLHADFPQMHTFPICADITQPFALPEGVAGFTKVGFFPGSSIGNFSPQDARQFLVNVRETVGQGGALIIGVDRKKSKQILLDAYNDADGVTAAFNLNVLQHFNYALEANFDVTRFGHEATYNEEQGCIQMFLKSQDNQTVNIAGVNVEFCRDEALHTENSHKYHPEEFLMLAGEAGFREQAFWCDTQDWFSLYLLQGV